MLITWILLGLAAGGFAAGTAFGPQIASALSARMRRNFPVAIPVVVATLFCFLVLVGCGVTGSSIEKGIEKFPIAGLTVKRLFGTGLSVRSDDWGVSTPLAIGQARHEPRFPIVNTNLGPDGQNMLLVSVPVWHISALARPATWGFFFLDLPRALAWSWWFPIFGCFLASWATFQIVLPGRYLLAMAMSGLLLMSPYFAAWSFAPASVVMFGAGAFSSAHALLDRRTRGAHLGLSVLLGLCMAGYALLLYPAWQVPVAYLLLALFVGVALRDREILRPSWRSIAWIVAAAILALGIVFAWWTDARQAIEATRATIYPGQRAATQGSDVEPWFWAKGMTNLVTMYMGLDGYSNQSEVASFVYFVVPAAMAAFWAMARRRQIDYVALSLLVFMAFAVVYLFIGFPASFASWSLWGRTTPYRADIAIGLAAVALVGSVLAGNNCATCGGRDNVNRAVALLATVIWVGCIALGLNDAPPLVKRALGPGLKIAIIFAVAFASYFLAMGRIRAFLPMAAIWALAASLPFNPLLITESTQVGTTPTADVGSTNCDPGKGRAVFIGSNMPAMMAMASGCPVLNGVHFYPQQTLWRALDPQRRWTDVYNRYQHLFFEIAPLPEGSNVKFASPIPDVVEVTLDPAHFDFRTLPADYIVVRRQASGSLAANASVHTLPDERGDWLEFRIRRDG